MLTMTGAITGSAVTGLTSPTYTLTSDTAVDAYTAQSAVTSLGGTQTGVSVHSVSQPFTVTARRPRSLKVPGKPNLNGYIANVGRNTYSILIRKGVLPLAGQPYAIAIARLEFEVPAGSELAAQPDLKALASFACGFLNSNASGLYDTWVNGLLKA